MSPIIYLRDPQIMGVPLFPVKNMQNSSTDIKVSIIIRAFNEEEHLEKLLLGIQSQKVSFKYETILVDSGSTDATVDIALKFGVKVFHIPPESFSFGYSLNKGIENTNGEFCAIISAHCYPRNAEWLEILIKPFEDPSVALVYGRQIGNQITKYSEKQIFAQWFYKHDGGKQQTLFCNNANSAIRKNLWNKYKYNEMLTGLEDIDWAKYAISKGYYLYYATNAVVIHVHNESFVQVYRRYKREAIAMKEVSPEESFTFFEFIKLFISNTLSDYYHAFKDRLFLRNIMSIPIMRFIQFWGAYKGFQFKNSISSDLKLKFYYPRRNNIFKIKKEKNKE